MSSAATLCPSARCEPGALLLGIVLPMGRIGYSRERLVINEDFVQVATRGRAPEKRFRFSSPCVQGACKQWNAGRCDVIDEVVAELAPNQGARRLPECAIRPDCRWFLQSGVNACLVCPLVITDRMTPYGGPAVDGHIDSSSSDLIDP